MNWFSAGELLELALSRVIPRSRTKGVLKAPFVLEESMTDDKTKTSADRKRISMLEDYEVRYWTKKFGVTKEQLIEAVRKVGLIAEDVARELGK